MKATVVPSPDVPVVENIHQKILAAVTAKPDAFDMGSWHNVANPGESCETTHCRAGWVVTLAGEAGKALELFHDTPLAAFLIYKASSPSIPVRMPSFYVTNEEAMADMERCANEERALVEGGR